ncbi:MAG: universal stress protein [Adhaeribacter sp.]
MRIVVPIDFSANAKVAAKFALVLARQSKAEVILLHVLPSLGPTMGLGPSEFIKKELIDWTEAQFSSFTASLPSADLPLSHQIAYGAGVEKVIEPFIAAHDIDLVVMGSKGASGLKKILLGSNTVAVINESRKPVIVVPEHAEIKPICQLVYASDLKQVETEVRDLLPYAHLLQTGIKIIHVPPLEYLEHLHTQALEEDLKRKTGFTQIEVELISGEDIVLAIEHYAAAAHQEMLVLFTRRTGFLEQLFSKSITREIACRNQVPMLVINNRL